VLVNCIFFGSVARCCTAQIAGRALYQKGHIDEVCSVPRSIRSVRYSFSCAGRWYRFAENSKRLFTVTRKKKLIGPSRWIDPVTLHGESKSSHALASCTVMHGLLQDERFKKMVDRLNGATKTCDELHGFLQRGSYCRARLHVEQLHKSTLFYAGTKIMGAYSQSLLTQGSFGSQETGTLRQACISFGTFEPWRIRFLLLTGRPM